jgi:hypothetical protein
MDTDPTGLTTDQLETRLIELETMVGHIRRLQAGLISEADRRQLPLADGARTLIDWVAARLDVTHPTARRLVTLTHTSVEGQGLSFDRTVALTRLAQTTGRPVDVDDYAGYDLAGLYRQVAHHRHLTPIDEQDAVRDRFVAIQPNLDQSCWRLWGQLPGTDGALVEQALTARGDSLPEPPEGMTATRGQRSADALVSMAMDSLDHPPTESTGTGPTVSIVCDARDAASTNGETGASVVGGPRVGPQALEEVLCDGTIEVVALTSDGTPLAVGNSVASIPPRLRRYILTRDQACTVDGCGSRYRLQPHHIIQRVHGGPHRPTNLTTLCWFHHHRVIHGLGYTIDPTSPTHRRRLNPPAAGGDPPP